MKNTIEFILKMGHEDHRSGSQNRDCNRITWGAGQKYKSLGPMQILLNYSLKFGLIDIHYKKKLTKCFLYTLKFENIGICIVES